MKLFFIGAYTPAYARARDRLGKRFIKFVSALIICIIFVSNVDIRKLYEVAEARSDGNGSCKEQGDKEKFFIDVITFR